MPGPHGFAVRVGVVRQRVVNCSQAFQPALPSRHTPDAAASTASRPHVRDDRETPLMWDRTAGDIDLIWVSGEGKYFSKWGWTGESAMEPFHLYASLQPRNWKGDSDRETFPICRSGRTMSGGRQSRHHFGATRLRFFGPLAEVESDCEQPISSAPKPVACAHA